MNLRKVVFVVSAVVGLTATLAAQRATPGGKSKAPSKADAKSVTITGCVAQGIDADHYRLANAVRREQPPSSTGPYDLQGGEFKAHLGHKVEVTGTSGSTGKTSDTTASEGGTARKHLPRFNVLSVKMLSATCS